MFHCLIFLRLVQRWRLQTNCPICYFKSSLFQETTERHAKLTDDITTLELSASQLQSSSQMFRALFKQTMEGHMQGMKNMMQRVSNILKVWSAFVRDRWPRVTSQFQSCIKCLHIGSLWSSLTSCLEYRFQAQKVFIQCFVIVLKEKWSLKTKFKNKFTNAWMANIY